MVRNLLANETFSHQFAYPRKKTDAIAGPVPIYYLRFRLYEQLWSAAI